MKRISSFLITALLMAALAGCASLSYKSEPDKGLHRGHEGHEVH